MRKTFEILSSTSALPGVEPHPQRQESVTLIIYRLLAPLYSIYYKLVAVDLAEYIARVSGRGRGALSQADIEFCMIIIYLLQPGITV